MAFSRVQWAVVVMLVTTMTSSSDTVEGKSSAFRKHPVFLKFYKVGSETIVDFMLRMSVNPKQYKSWAATSPTCDGLPMDHKTLYLYIKFGDELGSVCCRDAERACATEFVTILRNPVERFISQLFFFSGSMTQNYLFSSGQRAFTDTNYVKRMKVLWSRILRKPKDIAVSDIETFMEYLRQRGSDSFFPKLSMNSFEVVLSRQRHHPYVSSSSTLDLALKRLESFAVVGTMEYMPSMFVLLSLKYGHPLTDSCLLHNRHGDKKIPFKKPKSSELDPGVISLMSSFMLHDKKIWLRAQEIHKERLLSFNHTVQSATELWKHVCSKVPKNNALSPQMWIDDKRFNNSRSEHRSHRNSYVSQRKNKKSYNYNNNY